MFFNDCFHLPQVLPQTVFFGFFNTYSNNLILENHILLPFKIYLYNSREQGEVTLKKLIRIIANVKDIEKESVGTDDCQNIENMLLFFKKDIMLVSTMIQMGKGMMEGEGGGGVLCFVFFLPYIKYDTFFYFLFFFIFPLYLFVFVILILFLSFLFIYLFIFAVYTLRLL